MSRLLSPCEARTAAAQVWELIISSGQTGKLLRKQDGENIYGTDEGTFAEVCSFAVETTNTPPVDIGQKADAKASVLPTLDVRVGDRVRIGENEYRVQSIVEESLFGSLTHKVLELVALHGSE